MHRLLFSALLAATSALAQPAPDAFEITQRFAQSGAAQLALARIVRLQPADSKLARWAEWENLRCVLLAQLGRHQDLFKRVAGLPADVPEKALRPCLVEAARSAAANGQAATARAYLARLLWRGEPGPLEIREARLIVIDSYLVEQKPDEAYRLMLRFQQDYQPLAEQVATRFTEALLAFGRERDAVNWFSQLDEANPAKLLMRMKTGLINPEQAIAQARAQLAKTPAIEGLWIALREAAQTQQNRPLELAALEHVADLGDTRAPARTAALTAALWRLYGEVAREVANDNKLLVGDDANWSDFAARRLAGQPTVARAMYAQLALDAASRESRLNAQLQLVFALQQAKLERAAVRLFGDPQRFPAAQLDPQARYLLGAMAADSNQPALAAHFLDGLPTPPNVAPEEWQLRLATVQLRAGAPDKAAAALRGFVAGKQALAPPLLRRAAVLARDLAEAGQAPAAEEILRALLPFAEPVQKREIAFSLGRLAEHANEPWRAAELYLEAALMGATDALAVNARLDAAIALLRAGMRADARAQLEWLRKNAKDPAQLEIVRRELARF